MDVGESGTEWWDDWCTDDDNDTIDSDNEVPWWEDEGNEGVDWWEEDGVSIMSQGGRSGWIRMWCKKRSGCSVGQDDTRVLEDIDMSGGVEQTESDLSDREMEDDACTDCWMNMAMVSGCKAHKKKVKQKKKNEASTK